MTDLADRRGFDTEVYEPAEDSALLAGAVVEVLDPDDRVLDVGTGSGYLARRARDETDATAVGVDVNPQACRRAHDEGVETVRGDRTEPFKDATFDVVAFNPPYLPVDPDAEWDDWFETAISGGPSGRSVVERFLDDVGRVLVPDGIVFLLVSTYTDPEAVVEYAGEQGFSAAAVADATFPGETLTVIRLWR